MLTCWAYLISEFLVAYNIAASDWPCTFYSQAVLFSMQCSAETYHKE